MNKAVEKFVLYLDELDKHYKQNERFYKILEMKAKIKNEPFQYNRQEEEIVQSEIYNLKRLLTKAEETQANFELFDDFEILCRYLKTDELTDRDKLGVLEYFINYNHQLNQSTLKNVVIDPRLLEKADFKTIEMTQVKMMLRNGTLKDFMITDPKTLTQEEMMQRLEISNNIRKCTVNLDKYIRYSQMIYRHYISKKNTYTRNDVKYIKYALKNIGVTDEVLKSVLHIIENSAHRNEKKTKKTKN